METDPIAAEDQARESLRGSIRMTKFVHDTLVESFDDEALVKLMTRDYFRACMGAPVHPAYERMAEAISRMAPEDE